VENQGNSVSNSSVTLSRKEYDKLLFQLADAQRQLGELNRMIFGSKSERFVGAISPEQLALFELEQAQEEPKGEQQEITYKREVPKKDKEQPIRTKIPGHLPRKEEIIEPENIDPRSRKIGEEITEVLEITPSKIYVRKIVRPKYSKPNNEGVIIADLPNLPLPKSNAGVSLLVYIIVSKFVDHLPLYRLIQIFKRQGVDIKKSTISGWSLKVANLLHPLYDKLKEAAIAEADYLQMDESPIKVQDKDKKGANHQGYMWVLQNTEKKTILFQYDKSRGQAPPRELLGNFSGTLQTDGYKVYGALAKSMDFDLLACMAHIRRYFEKALDNDVARAEYILFKIQELYRIEAGLKEQKANYEQIRLTRQELAKPILDDMEEYMLNQRNKVLPKSSIGIAFNYALTIFENMKRYVEDGRFKIDNNLTENAIRPLAIGRKNYLFAGSHDAAQSYAMFYSFFATCKANDVNPTLWLADVLTRINEHKANKLHELLPQNWKKK
jgi:transposase